MAAWTGADRILSLRASIAGEFSTDTDSGLSVQGRVSNTGITLQKSNCWKGGGTRQPRM